MNAKKNHQIKPLKLDAGHNSQIHRILILGKGYRQKMF